MIWVGVGERDQRERPVLDLAANPPARLFGRGVYQHVLREIDVDAVSRETPELPQVGRELPQAGGAG
jgi:hypothetical protein